MNYMLNTYIWSADLLARLRIFSTGVSIGIISSTLSNKNELDALKGTVKRMENLIQDLHDELEMREGLTVKELPNEMSVKIDGKVSTTKTKNFLLHTQTEKNCIVC